MRAERPGPGSRAGCPVLCWDSLIYPVYVTSDMYIHIYNGKHRRRRRKEKKKREKRNPMYVRFIFTRGGLHRVTRPYHIQSTGGLSPVSCRNDGLGEGSFFFFGWKRCSSRVDTNAAQHQVRQSQR